MRQKQKEQIVKDLKEKMVFLVGPRQVGKTYLAKEIAKNYKNPVYLNYDYLPDRKQIKEFGWLSDVDLVIFDELHKMPKWKNFLKGVYDTRNPNMHILVTGSARLDTFKKSGDSMAGRFFLHHLLPITLREMHGTEYESDLDRLIERGGFPEAFFAEDLDRAERWRVGYVDTLIRKDVLDFQDIDKIRVMQEVFDILRTKVGSQISYTNIAQDVGVSVSTVKRYVEILQALYIIYLVRPYAKKISRSILKEPKVYFYDTGLVNTLDGDSGGVFENLVANALQKHVKGLRDLKGQVGDLKYLRNKEGKEVDFAIVDKNNNLSEIVEVKLSDSSLSKNLEYFSARTNSLGVQVVKNIKNGFKVSDKLEVREAKNYLSNLFL